MKNLPILFKSVSTIALAFYFIFLCSFQTEKTVWLSSLDLSKMNQGAGSPLKDKNNIKGLLSIAKQAFTKGVGTRVKSYVWIDLDGGSDRFIANVGIDDDTTRIGDVKLAYATTHNFEIFGDGKKIWQSGPMNYGQAAKKADINVKGIKTLILTVVNSGKSDSYVQADWADAHFIVSGKDPKTILPPPEDAVILTPKPSPAPRINGPKVYGCHPGNPFIYRVPVTGHRPIQFSAKGLPAGLTLNSITGIITGTVAKRGIFNVTLNAKNSKGKDSRLFKIKCGDMLALTPTMGWNSWYAHYASITERKIRTAADVIVSSGMADAGYQYVNIDDSWPNKQSDPFGHTEPDPAQAGPPRDSQGNILPNSHFPNMKKLTDYIHLKGLKAGIYNTPGNVTCLGYTGCLNHEAQDAKRFADWGFDFLKYDWCWYNMSTPDKLSLAIMQQPYRLMGAIVKKQKRDMVFNLCQYGMGEVWKWGAEVGGQSWRTGGDLGGELNRLFEVVLRNTSYGAYNKPGAWNDPDYIQIGYLGTGISKDEAKPSGFTPNEEYSFMSLWCLMAAPLVYSGQLNKLNEFTLNILCNPEVIAVDQDPLGKCGKVVQKNDDSFIIVKELEDGSKAVGLSNTGEVPIAITLKWADMHVTGQQTVRDLWRQKNLGSFTNEFTAMVPRHGTMVLRVIKENKQ